MSDFGSFDPTVVEPSVTGGKSKPIPAGKYKAVIKKAEFKKTKAGDGEYLNLAFEVVKGEHMGARVYALLNLRNKNPTAVEIAEGELSAICHAIGLMKPKQTEQLLDNPLVIGVSVVRETYNGNEVDKNKIVSYESTETASAQMAKTQADIDNDPFS